jgi:solute carrier family 35 (UDP-sugar transporter), member A1/2/3
MTVPSLLYVLQNNLLYVSASNLDAATYQGNKSKNFKDFSMMIIFSLYFFLVTYQLKILTTAMFAVFMLQKKLMKNQWLSLLILVCGVALVQLSQGGESRVIQVEQNKVMGFSSALGACVLSGFAGIYFEKMLKTSDVSVWMRNIQLSLLSLPLSFITCFASDGARISKTGFFFGYDFVVFFLILLNAGGGLIVAVVVKYADNILKGFATSLAIILSCFASVFLFNFLLTFQFVFGTCFVIVSVFLYSHDPNKNRNDKKISNIREEKEALLEAQPQDI